MEFAVLYLGVARPEVVGYALDAGLAFMPVTLADRFDGPAAVAACRAVGLPEGCTVWLDVEGSSICPPTMAPEALIVRVERWALEMTDAGFEAGVYVGSPQPLTAKELYALRRVTRYWKAPSDVVDRFAVGSNGPSCGFSMFQVWPSVFWPDDADPDRVFVDVDFVSQDHRGRSPHWAVRD